MTRLAVGDPAPFSQLPDTARTGVRLEPSPPWDLPGWVDPRKHPARSSSR